MSSITFKYHFTVTSGLSRCIITAYGLFQRLCTGYPRTRGRRVDVRVLLAFTAIYVLWGGTFLAIRIAVLEIPPFFSSGVRFLIAGALLYAVMRLRGQPSPSASRVAQHRDDRAVHVRRDLRRAFLG